MHVIVLSCIVLYYMACNCVDVYGVSVCVVWMCDVLAFKGYVEMWCVVWLCVVLWYVVVYGSECC